ncbi:sensor domain-containing diguanylate cyclase [Aestuariirhabdus sp. LZHN29]|uniref:sensor domain-containing diguanylate cyclase n=1 Tax=Aestuariirhabdus sp. LZHN29 TaxID=3417462 RepID=UPI003CF0BF59
MEPLWVDEGNSHTRRSLWLVWGAGCLMLGLVLSLGWSRYQVQGEKLLDDQLRSMEPIADFLAADTERVLYGTRQLFHATRIILEQHGDLSPQSPELQHNLQQLLQGQNYLDELLVLDPLGRVKHWNRPDPPPSLHQQPWAQPHLQSLPPNAAISVGLPQRSPFGGEGWGFVICQQMLDEKGESLGTLVAWVSLPRFAARYDRVVLPVGSRLALAGDDGEIYFQLPGADRRYGQREVLPNAAREQSTFPRSFHLDGASVGEPLLVATSQVAEQPLWAAMALSKDMAIRSWREELPWVLMMLALLCALFIGGMIQISLQLLAGDRRRALLAVQASTDALTGAFNRRYLSVIARQLRRGREQDQHCCVCVIDIDRFKELNDRYGHALGDEALKRVALTLQDVCRDSDQLVRFGGDEFVLILPQTSLEGAHTIAQKCCLAVQRIALMGGGARIDLTGSFGVTQWLPHEPLDGALARADGALYEAKDKGRNRVELADGYLTGSGQVPYRDE